MADDKVKTSRPGFLSKLKGSKGVKEDASKDVDDFLKPSIDKAALMRPRIDIAIAQRWPEAQTVQDSHGLPSFETPQNPNGLRKKRRREGLVVGFVSTAPEIMGEGGDESPYPTIEISRMKERQRPATDIHRRSIDGLSRPQQFMNGTGTNTKSEEQEPKPLRRANTSHHESPSPSLQRYGQSVPNAVGPEGGATASGLDPNTARLAGTPLSQHDRKRSLMNLSEGMALRRASSIPDFDGLAGDDDDNNDNDDPDDPPPHFGPGKDLKNFSTPRMAPIPPRTATRTLEHSTPRVTQLQNADADSPTGSPFDDPKYVGGRAQAARASRGPPQRTPQTMDRATPPQRYSDQASYAVPSRQQPQQRSMAAETSARPIDTRPDGDSSQYVAYTDPARNYSQTSLQSAQRSRSNTQPSTPNMNPQTAASGQENLDPTSASSDREMRSIQPSPVDPTGGEIALADFATRVAHMKGVFQLTAQKERPDDKCTPDAWLRTAFWWYLKGKLGLEFEVRQRAHSIDSRELLLQGHVDLAKAWWILLYPLQSYGQAATPSASAPHLQRGYAELQGNMQGLCMSLRRNNILPPSASLIQGQDTRLWLSEASSLNSPHLTQYGKAITLLDALPLGDRDGQFCYSRYPVSIALSDQQGNVDQTTTSGLLTVIRPRESYYTGVTIASQDDWLTLKVNATTENNSISWRDVSWSSSMTALTITLPDGIAVNVRLQQGDYKSLGNMVEYTRNAVRARQAAQNETLLYQAQLASLAYSTSQGASAFPRDAVGHCQVLVFRARGQHEDAHRVIFVTEPSVKIVSCASHSTADLGSCVDMDESQSRNSLSIRFTEARKQSRAIMTFHNQQDMLAFQSLARSGQAVPKQASESILANNHNARQPEPATAPAVHHPSGDQLCAVPLLSHEIRSAAEVLQAHDVALPSTLPLQWRGLTVQRLEPVDDAAADGSDHVDGLKVMLVHANGSFQDRLGLQKGELAMRLEPDIGVPKIEVLREPQPSFDASVDVQSCPPPVAGAIGRAVQLARQQSTIRTFMFPTLEALHQFQAAITGFDVRYDGLASNFAISRRMMVVPIHHKWTANNVRLQIVSNAQGSVVRLNAFMDGFDHADAMCFQVKSTDVFEKIKGDSKGKKWSVKLVDAKFSLPGKAGKKEDEIAYKSRRRYVNLEGLDYAEEHDDVTIGFDTEDSRDLFTRALPAATTVGRMITLRRRI
ncbi:hypothetical protein AMS68_004136 [Peltaster fructicola]|uniref:Uncharacterized protein n=1 Tax=Peltaster fructicola TaxID=286661 RepID=A0A6H0XVH3_9PEZI|nr:hypothetical protein AMS68_004136 [Peltaster fructicola]